MSKLLNTINVRFRRTGLSTGTMFLSLIVAIALALPSMASADPTDEGPGATAPTDDDLGASEEDSSGVAPAPESSDVAPRAGTPVATGQDTAAEEEPARADIVEKRKWWRESRSWNASLRSNSSSSDLPQPERTPLVPVDKAAEDIASSDGVPTVSPVGRAVSEASSVLSAVALRAEAKTPTRTFNVSFDLEGDGGNAFSVTD